MRKSNRMLKTIINHNILRWIPYYVYTIIALVFFYVPYVLDWSSKSGETDHILLFLGALSFSLIFISIPILSERYFETEKEKINFVFSHFFIIPMSFFLNYFFLMGFEKYYTPIEAGFQLSGFMILILFLSNIINNLRKHFIKNRTK